MTSNPFFAVEPDVPGGLGPESELDFRAGTYPMVTRLHYEISWGPLPLDDLLTSHPVYLVTAPLADALSESGMSGLEVSPDLLVTVEAQVELFVPGWRPPEIRWLKVNGVAGIHDLGLTPNASLVVSERALQLLRRFRLERCRISRVG